MSELDISSAKNQKHYLQFLTGTNREAKRGPTPCQRSWMTCGPSGAKIQAPGHSSMPALPKQDELTRSQKQLNILHPLGFPSTICKKTPVLQNGYK